jgi:hypothetical protein
MTVDELNLICKYGGPEAQEAADIARQVCGADCNRKRVFLRVLDLIFRLKRVSQ